MAAMTPKDKKSEEEASEPKKPESGQEDHAETRSIRYQFEKSEEKLLDRSWLQTRSQEELISAILEAVLELKAKIEKSTEQVAIAQPPIAFRADADIDVEKYVRLPLTLAEEKDAAETEKRTWRVILVGAEAKHEPLGLEIYNDVTFGRLAPGGTPPDLDLTKYDAGEKGVSRRHALLRPTETKLLLLDLGSTNGTFCNGTRLKVGGSVPINDNDTISLGGMHFKVKIVSQPGKPAA